MPTSEGLASCPSLDQSREADATVSSFAGVRAHQKMLDTRVSREEGMMGVVGGNP